MKESVLRRVGHTSDARQIEANLGGETPDLAADDGQRESAGHAPPIIGGWDALFAIRLSLFAISHELSAVSTQHSAVKIAIPSDEVAAATDESRDLLSGTGI
jgi:hypothetical protein